MIEIKAMFTEKSDALLLVEQAQKKEQLPQIRKSDDQGHSGHPGALSADADRCLHRHRLAQVDPGDHGRGGVRHGRRSAGAEAGA